MYMYIDIYSEGVLKIVGKLIVYIRGDFLNIFFNPTKIVLWWFPKITFIKAVLFHICVHVLYVWLLYPSM